MNPHQYWITIAQGNHATAKPGFEFDAKLSVIVLDSRSNLPAPDGIKVNFQVIEGDVRLRYDENKWGERATAFLVNGQASITAKALSSANKDAIVEASLDDEINNLVRFLLQIQTDCRVPDGTPRVSRLEILHDRQAAFIRSESFPAPLKVIAYDANNSPVEQAIVQFHINGKTGTKLPAQSPSPTNRYGVTEVSLIPGDVAEEFSVDASANGHLQTFNLAILPSPSDLSILLDEQKSLYSFYLETNETLSLKVSVADREGKKWPYISISAQISNNFTDFHFTQNGERPSNLKEIFIDKDKAAYLSVFSGPASERASASLSLSFSTPKTELIQSTFELRTNSRGE